MLKNTLISGFRFSPALSQNRPRLAGGLDSSTPKVRGQSKATTTA